MRVTKLSATNVHGYLPVRVEFLPDLTFLTGLNGSGKTTALRLLMGLLTPSVEELARIEFSEAEVEVETDAGRLTIRATREGGALVITSSDVEDSLRLAASEIALLL